eukprot:m.303499 g.303499  ORF g.303499 m.303499 type:complete len:134 (-) comp15893_c0_seq9:3131-3532(-)
MRLVLVPSCCVRDTCNSVCACLHNAHIMSRLVLLLVLRTVEIFSIPKPCCLVQRSTPHSPCYRCFSLHDSTLQSLGMIKTWREQHVLVPKTEVVDAVIAKRKQGKGVRIDPFCLRWTPPLLLQADDAESPTKA